MRNGNVLSVVPGNRLGDRCLGNGFVFLLSRGGQFKGYGVVQKTGSTGETIVLRW